MQVDYKGKTYTVGNYYMISVPNSRLVKNAQDTNRQGNRRVRAKLILKEYPDGEQYGTYAHYGLIFEYQREWNGVLRKEDMTFPDALL